MFSTDEIKLNTDFSYSYYEQIIIELKKRYQIINSIKDLKNIDKFCLLRHDIDICPKIALNFASFENSLNVKSLYMFLYNSNFYKLEDYISEVASIIELGHKIGIHFDCSKSNKDNIYNNIEDVKSIFKNKFKIKVDSISFHRPKDELIGGDEVINNLTNCYSAKLVKYYISDSRYSWRVGDPIKYIKKNRPYIQILTHPIWWSEHTKDPVANFSNFFNNKKIELHDLYKIKIFKKLIFEDFPSLENKL
jgi:hypothetical protein